METRWEPYKLLACVTHHGAHLETDHYRVLVREGAEHWILDDARQIKKASNEQLEEATASVYLLLVARESASSSPEPSQHSNPVGSVRDVESLRDGPSLAVEALELHAQAASYAASEAAGTASPADYDPGHAAELRGATANTVRVHSRGLQDS